tara:strand:+ start:12985 stop:14049 length:1065 start_codon:yes stop_codon:yes gene_type:complete
MVKKVIHKFEVEYIQVLDEEGNVDEELMPDISDEEIKKIYETMILIRVFDQKAFNMQRQGRIGTYIQYKGQEACQVGCGLPLRDDDFVFPMYRESGLLIVRKQPLRDILLYWGGDERGLISPEGINNFPISIPVGTQVVHAAGAAWASKLQGRDQVAVVGFGDGATSKGDFHEGLNFAGVYKAPAIFFCQNNQFAISVPRNKQTHSETIAQKAIAYGIKGVQVDGNDIFGVLKVMKEAVGRGRKGEGPTLIECYTYRMGDHSTSDDPKRYRDDEEVKKWEKKDPILRLEKFLDKKGIMEEGYKEEILEKCKIFVEKEVEAFEKVEQPDKNDIFNFVYEEMTPRLKEEMEELNKE